MSSSAENKEKEAYRQRERLKNYDKSTEKFKNNGQNLRSQVKIEKNYTKLDFIHYIIIFSILVSLVAFSIFLALTYIPYTKSYLMHTIETLLNR